MSIIQIPMENVWFLIVSYRSRNQTLLCAVVFKYNRYEDFLRISLPELFIIKIIQTILIFQFDIKVSYRSSLLLRPTLKYIL